MHKTRLVVASVVHNQKIRNCCGCWLWSDQLAGNKMRAGKVEHLDRHQEKCQRMCPDPFELLRLPQTDAAIQFETIKDAAKETMPESCQSSKWKLPSEDANGSAAEDEPSCWDATATKEGAAGCLGMADPACRLATQIAYSLRKIRVFW